MDGIEVKITFDPDDIDASDFTWGDMEDLQAGKFEVLRKMVERYGTIHGIPEEVPDSFRDSWLTNYLRGMRFSDMLSISTAFLEVVKGKSNPVDENGKNSNGGSRSTLARGRASRR